MHINKLTAVAIAAIMVTGICHVVRANEPAPAAAAKAITMQTTCPVMEGQPINKKLFVDFEGKRIYVCCGTCVKMLKKDPAKYVKMLEAQGVTLDKAQAPAPKK